ncbi:MAG: hypothetical protein JWO97_1305 [Acidobacteria bacterium]|nr:hypothetical protein [Acidobacteriota bacterium]
MRRLLIFIAIAMLALPAFSGTAYDFRSATTGIRKTTMSGHIEVEGKNLRMNVVEGDGKLFRNGAIVLSKDGGKTLVVTSPSDKTFYEVNLNDLLGGAGAMLKSLGDLVKITFDNQKVAVRDAGAGETIEGYPTRKSLLDASYDMNVITGGQKMSTHMSMKTESWTTDRIAADAMNWFQTTGVRTGIDGIDKLIEAQSRATKGGFPLKQVTTVTVDRGGQKMVSTTMATVTNIATRPIAAKEFAMPAGYRKVPSPLDRMMAGRP